MIQAAGTLANGRRLLIVGLDGENITRLLADEPILVDTARYMGLPPMSVWIVGGRDEPQVAARIRAMRVVPPV